jgi:hypothetical protein
VVVERIDDQPVRQLALVLDRLSGQDLKTGALRRPDRVGKQCAFADPGAAEHHDDAAGAGADVPRHRAESLSLDVTTH